MSHSNNFRSSKIDVSVIIPIYNGEQWIDACFASISRQTALRKLNIEVCVCNDASSDNTGALLKKWIKMFRSCDVRLRIVTNKSLLRKGVGFSRNKAVEKSCGSYLCFQDIDDIMLPGRIIMQHGYAKELPNDNALIGCKFLREPPNSTVRYTRWANSLSPLQLNRQIYTSNGSTIIMPTWFCHRNVFHRIGGFCEDGHGTPEDLIFFYKHLDNGGKIYRVNETLLIYTYHPNAETFSIDEKTIWNIRMERLEKKVLLNWSKFTIWNAGKQGRRFFKSLKSENKEKVVALCDVDPMKIGKIYEIYDKRTRSVIHRLNIIHYKEAEKPFVICVKQGLTNGEFEKNLSSLKLVEGRDFILFS